MIVHRSNGKLWSVASLCSGSWPVKLTDRWERVTCKRCLKMKKRVKRDAAGDSAQEKK